MKYAIITTTIFVPTLLEKYASDVKKYGRDCFFVVIGDKKTPSETKGFCSGLAEAASLDVVYMDVEDQEKYLQDFPELGEHLPYNSIQRRNIGILYAYQRGADVIITIDDDNFLVTEDFVGMHAVGLKKGHDIISSSTGWLNVCSFLKEESSRIFYHRGFPLEMRFKEERLEITNDDVTTVVNAGFWLEDPDIDALTRLYYFGKPINATNYERTSNFALAHGTWSTFNSQNTALSRQVIPAYFLSPMVGRYDDIWGAYVLKRITDHMGHHISFGFPIVKQERNPHNYWKDLDKEHVGMELTLTFVEALQNIQLSEKNYATCYEEIADGLPDALGIKELKNETHRVFLENYIQGMHVWRQTFARLAEKAD